MTASRQVNELYGPGVGKCSSEWESEQHLERDIGHDNSVR
jgi:hypothetical protein